MLLVIEDDGGPQLADPAGAFADDGAGGFDGGAFGAVGGDAEGEGGDVGGEGGGVVAGLAVHVLERAVEGYTAGDFDWGRG